MKDLLPSFCSLTDQMNNEILTNASITCNLRHHISDSYFMTLNIFERSDNQKKFVCLGIRRYHKEPDPDSSLRFFKEIDCTLSTSEIWSLLHNTE